MTINTQNSFLISSLLHFLCIVIFIAIPKPDYSIEKQVIDISFLLSNIENEIQSNKKLEENPVIKGRADLIKPEKKIEYKTIQHITAATHEKILSESEKRKETNQQEQKGQLEEKVHNPVTETVRRPVEEENRISGLPASQSSDVSLPSTQKGYDSYGSTAGVKSDVYRTISAQKDIATTAYTISDFDDFDLSAIIRSFINKIESVKQYPYIARKKGIEGTVILYVHLSKTGELKEVVLKSSSGYEILDKSAIELIKRVTPFRHSYHNDLKIEIPISYRLKR
ncbi:MAG: TonB family protein [candidate division WOR-3 bacterium]